MSDTRKAKVFTDIDGDTILLEHGNDYGIYLENDIVVLATKKDVQIFVNMLLEMKEEMTEKAGA